MPYGHIDTPLARVHLELTNRCNFDCTFCPQSLMTRPPGAMPTDQAKRIITELKDAGICRKITLHVMGEPTLHPGLFEILDHAAQMGLPVGLTTNGAALAGRIGRRLADYDLGQVDISLQTPDQHSFALRQAGRVDFEAYRQGILHFFEAYWTPSKTGRFKFRFLTRMQLLPKGGTRDRPPLPIIATNRQFRAALTQWTEEVYALLGVDAARAARARQRLQRLSIHRWNVVEIQPRLFLENYVLWDWGVTATAPDVIDAWAGTCFGMQDHFAILYNGDVVLCCMDFDGRTVMGNLNRASLKEILSSDRLGRIVTGFKRHRLVHPYCRKCLGSRNRVSWLVKPLGGMLGLRVLKPLFYRTTSVYR